VEGFGKFSRGWFLQHKVDLTPQRRAHIAADRRRVEEDVWMVRDKGVEAVRVDAVGGAKIEQLGE
jgi:hypothetical protein